ncbi:CPCC family cysteine-rich protein [Ktedonobacter robiniae]|uniref:Membrane protein n=1 Tax=Ktedonobacter robiniae TaxID=2778365 RepID=A0ABQ3UHI3_9CHLR|nr:CPCC family cysteine-rich protein [Ktedonobacter robiniae]GHO52163.1 membrane protein [Ktedonobacter robiniae]
MTNTKKFACDCCGFLTLEEDPWGSYEICDVCFWEQNHGQVDEPDNPFGPNRITLREARENFKRFGAIDERSKPFVRPPFPEEYPSQTDKP